MHFIDVHEEKQGSCYFQKLSRLESSVLFLALQAQVLNCLLTLTLWSILTYTWQRPQNWLEFLFTSFLTWFSIWLLLSWSPNSSCIFQAAFLLLPLVEPHIKANWPIAFPPKLHTSRIHFNYLIHCFPDSKFVNSFEKAFCFILTYLPPPPQTPSHTLACMCTHTYTQKTPLLFHKVSSSFTSTSALTV